MKSPCQRDNRRSLLKPPFVFLLQRGGDEMMEWGSITTSTRRVKCPLSKWQEMQNEEGTMLSILKILSTQRPESLAHSTCKCVRRQGGRRTPELVTGIWRSIIFRDSCFTQHDQKQGIVRPAVLKQCYGIWLYWRYINVKKKLNPGCKRNWKKRL